MSAEKVDLVIREETLTNERRTVITPDQVAQLTNRGFNIVLAKWDERIYSDDDYADAVKDSGNSDKFKIIEPNDWKNEAAYEGSIILGVKEIVDNNAGDKAFGLSRTYVHFDHSFKGQGGSDKRLSRFGNEPLDVDAVLLDHEYCVDDQGKRTHAFGKSAGYATAAISFLMWANKKVGDDAVLPKFSYDSKEEFFEQNIEKIQMSLTENGGVDSLVIGGEHGRSSKGAVEFIEDLRMHLDVTDSVRPMRWGRAETKEKQTAVGLDGINDYDIVINCTFTEEAVPSFMNDKTLQQRDDNALQVIGDVTCDTTPDKNRVRFAKYETTDFDDPIRSVGKNVHIVTIDHSPSFFPKEATDDISAQFFPQIVALLEARRDGEIVPENSPWARSLKAFENNMVVPVNAYHMGKNVSAGIDLVAILDDDREKYLSDNHENLEKVLVSLLAQLHELSAEEKDSFLFHVSTGLLNIHEYPNVGNWYSRFLPGQDPVNLDPLVEKLEKSLETHFSIDALCQSPEVVNAHALSKVVSEHLKDPTFIKTLGYDDKASFVEAFTVGEMSKELSLFLEYTKAARSMISPNEKSFSDVSGDFSIARQHVEHADIFPDSMVQDIDDIVSLNAEHEECFEV